jgi:hypothetical protein
MTWLLLRYVGEYFAAGRTGSGTLVANFRPVIGECDRRSLLTESVCQLRRVPKSELVLLDKDFDNSLLEARIFSSHE